MISALYIYDGDYKTKIRLRIGSLDACYVSNEFYGKIHMSQFKNEKPNKSERSVCRSKKIVVHSQM